MASAKRCCVPGCGSDSEILHKFPNPNKDIERFRTWIYNVGGDILAKDNEYIFNYRRVCNLHFEVQYHTRSKKLSANAVPTLNLKGKQFKNKDKPMDVDNSQDKTVNSVKSHSSMATNTKFTPYKKCCRTCLKEDFLMFDLFSEKLESSNIADMLVLCCKLDIQKDDTLPKQICNECFQFLSSFSLFCIKAKKAEEKLLNSMVNTSESNKLFSESDSLTIKIENDDHDYMSGSHEENEISLDENKNSAPYNSNISLNYCKVEEIKKEKEKLSRIDCNKYFSKPSKLKHEEKHLDKTDSRRKFYIEIEHNKNALPIMINEKKIDINVINESNTDSACVICSSKFGSMNLCSHHMNHMKIHKEEEGTYFCKKCNEECNNSCHLSHYNDQCSQTDSLNSITSKQNVIKNLCELNSDQYKCDKCSSTFKNIQSLCAHMRKHTEKGRILSCKECNKVFKKLSHLKRHEIQHNCPYKCSVCPKSYPTEDALDDHLNKHRGEKPHQCPICSKRFSLLSTIATHMRIHRSEKFKLCTICGKKFVSSTNLNQHMLRHSGLKRFACTLCPKKFVSKGELKTHTVTHTGERSYTCDQCGATFTNRSSLTKHIKILHLGMKPYQCETCLTRFTCSDHLKRHNRIHTGEKPYKCDMCDRAFTQSNDLLKHRRSHLGDKVYKCHECTEGFRLKVELRQHISEHFVSSQTRPTNVSKNSSTDGAGSLKPLATVMGGDNVDILQTDNSV